MRGKHGGECHSWPEPRSLDVMSLRTLATRWIPLASLATALLALAAQAVPRLPAADTWWHLAAGRFLVEQGRLPLVDPFSFGAGRGPWLNHEWLAEILFYLAFREWGLDGLFLLRTLGVVVAFGVLPLIGAYRLGVAPAWAAALVLACAMAAEGWAFFDARAYLFTYLGLSVTFLAGSETLRTGNPRFVLPLPVVTCFWANCHGGFILGPLALLVAAAGCCLPPRRFRLAAWFAGVALLSLALCAVSTPYGLETLAFPFSLLGRSAFSVGLNEWARPSLAGLGPYLALALVALALSLSPRGDWPRRLWLACFMAAGLVAWRHVPLGALAAAHLLPGFLPPAARPARWPGMAATAWTLALAASGWSLSARLAGGAEAWSLMRSHFPVAAAEFLNSNPGLPRDLYNPYEWGGYLDWVAWPRHRTFIDGRAHTVFTERRYAEALWVQYGDGWKALLDGAGLGSVLQGAGDWEQVLDSHGIQLVLASRLQGDLVDRISGSPRWFQVYSDPLSAVFLRDEPRWRALVPRLVRPESTWTRLERGLAALRSGREADALRLLAAVVDEDPGLSSARVYLGTLLLRAGREGEGEAQLREALRRDPGVREAHFNLAMLALRRGERSRALRELRAELETNPEHPQAGARLRELGGGG